MRFGTSFFPSAVRNVSILCAVTLAATGCGSSAGMTGGSLLPPVPRTPGAIVTNAAWGFEDANGEWKTESGEWVHLPAEDAANLFLWIEHAEGL